MPTDADADLSPEPGPATLVLLSSRSLVLFLSVYYLLITKLIYVHGEKTERIKIPEHAEKWKEQN